MVAPVELHRLRAFAAVAREGGFSRAARRLGQTQSSISQAVAALERDVGEPLLVRAGRRVELTEAGRVLLAHAERAFAELEAAAGELAALRDLQTGRLAVGTSDTLATWLLPAVLGGFRARHPGVELRLDNRTSPAIAAEVAARRLDLGVVSLPLPADLRLDGQPAEAALRIEPLIDQPDVLICPPAHRLARRRRVGLADLAGEPLLLLDRTTGSRAWLERRFAAARVRPHVIMEMSSVEVLKRLVELGFGLSIIPACAAIGAVAVVELSGLGKPRRVGIVTPTTGPLSRAARAFIEVARDLLEQKGTRT
jgi:DNA-binding transcriptional LysR family regulator